MFYIYGTLSVLWSVAWVIYARNEPRQMSSITPAEQDRIENDLGSVEVGYIEKLRLKDIPARDILTNLSLMALIVTGFCQAICDFVVFNMLPKYLNYAQGYNLNKNGLLR